MTRYYYKVYDVVVESELEIMNLPIESEIEKSFASVRLTDKESEFVPVGEYGVYYSPKVCALGTAWGTMEVSEGRLIKIYLKEGYNPSDAAPFIIGWGFAFLFNQLGYSIFHCSALNINDKGVIISGVSGAGKSSTTLSLIDLGARYLADDLEIFDPKRSMELIPAYPIQKVCRDVSISLDEKELFHINEGRDKFAYHNEKDYCNKKTKPTHIVLLKLCDGDEIIVKEHTGVDKWIRTMECLYLNEMFASFGIPDKDKQNCLMLAGNVRVLEIYRPQGKDTLSEITKTIYEFVNS